MKNPGGRLIAERDEADGDSPRSVRLPPRYSARACPAAAAARAHAPAAPSDRRAPRWLAATCRAAVLRRVGAPQRCAARLRGPSPLAGGAALTGRAAQEGVDDPVERAVRRLIVRQPPTAGRCGVVSHAARYRPTVSATVPFRQRAAEGAGAGDGVSSGRRFGRLPLCAARLATATDQSNGPPFAQPRPRRLAVMRRLAVGAQCARAAWRDVVAWRRCRTTRR